MITHDTFQALPADKARNYLRDLLVATGVLEPYEADIERMTPWLDQHLQRLGKPHADVLARYARWHVLPYLRRLSARECLTRATVLGWRSRVNAAARLLNWLTEQDTAFADLTQTELEHYFTTGGSPATLYSFLTWSTKVGLNRHIRVAPAKAGRPHVTMSDEDRWRQVELLLHDDSIRLYARIGGLFMLLFARPLASICMMRTEQISQSNVGRVSVTFDTVPIEMPALLDHLILEHLSRRGQASYVARDNGWLFPGGIPGKPLSTENIRAELVRNGIHPANSRKAALFALAAEVPAPVLADLIGIAPKTAVAWSVLAGRDWGQYMATRSHSKRD